MMVKKIIQNKKTKNYRKFKSRPTLLKNSSHISETKKKVHKRTINLTFFSKKYRFKNLDTRLKIRLKTNIQQYKNYLNEDLNSTPLYQELLALKAFIGDYSQKIHLTQNNFLYAFKNQYSFYNIYISIKLLTKASRFLKQTKKKNKFVFVGNPEGCEYTCTTIFKKNKIKFFSNDSWSPGFFSKSNKNQNIVLIIYNPTLNYIAFSEAINAAIPIVGFLTPQCNISNIDYPVILNLENAGFWYPSFCRTLNKK